MKKAQNGMAKMKKDPKEAMKKGMNFDKKSFDSLPKLKTKKAEKGGKFGMLSVKAGIDKNPNPTAADRIAGAKGLAKSGKKVAKKMMKSGGTLSAPKKDGLSMQLGYYQNTIGKNTKGKNTKAVGLTKAMYGKSMMKSGGKCKNGC
jgi:hypothetical protein